MARRKQPFIPDALLDGPDLRTAFNLDGVLDALKKLLAEWMLNAEMDQHLEEETADGRASTRNGYGQKTVVTDTGRSALDIPRGRQGTFDPQLIAKYQHRFPASTRRSSPWMRGV
jgi:putative transposase